MCVCAGATAAVLQVLVTEICTILSAATYSARVETAADHKLRTLDQVKMSNDTSKPVSLTTHSQVDGLGDSQQIR